MKIIELIINELEDFAGFDAVALVNQPAIEAGFHAFNSNIVDDALAFQIIKSACLDHFDLDVTNLPDFEPTGSKIEENYDFESYTDYPQSATNAAKRALEWRDSHPDQDCGTRVGWTRANQLANRRAISEETIARMASFARHLQHEDVPYSEGCGGLMVDAWGGRAGIEWASNKLEDIRESLSSDNYFDNLPSNIQEKLLERLSEIGYTHKDIEEDYYIYDEPQKFALPTRSSADPDGPTQTSGKYKILYQYSGPRDSKNRDFCRRLLDLNLLFRKEDIDKMTLQGDNSSQFGFYDIFAYKGSFGCRHRWNKKYVYMRKDTGLLEVAALLLDNKKQAEDNIKSPQQVGQFKFALEEEQMRVVGPLMIPDKLILRVDENEEPYFVFFSEETIRAIAYKMMKDKKLDEVNLEHDQEVNVEGFLEETWIIEDPDNDKQNAYGFDFPKGTWMGQYKVEDAEVWNDIKTGILNGFSIEGYFENRLVQNK